MWIELPKIVLLCFYFCTVVVAYNHHDSKQDYINKQKQYLYNRKNTLTTTDRPPNLNNNIGSSNRVRHQSRFPKFDSVKTMIDSRTTTQKPVTSYYNRRRHSGWNSYKTTTSTTTTTEDGLFENYGMMDEENDYFEDDDEDLDDEFYADDEGNTDNDDDGDESDYLFSNWQAEETTTTTTTKRPIQLQRYPSIMTEYKWERYGTQSRVQESRRHYMQMQSSKEQGGVNAFLEHFMRVKQEGQCRRPSPKVIPVQSVHPDASKTYTPHCTVLHRCAEDTGCCKHNTKCQYKTRVLVHLYFYTKALGSSDDTKVEKLSFFNHTECECKDKQSNDSSVEHLSASSGITLKSASNMIQHLYPQNLKSCTCPEVFVPKSRYDSSCFCDCETDNQVCNRMKKGKEYLGLKDRLCITNKECGVPVCEYGAYLRQKGRCPKKSEKLEDFRKLKIN